MNILYSKASFITLTIGFLSVVGFIIIILLQQNKTNDPVTEIPESLPTPVPLLYKDPKVLGISPHYTQALIAGESQEFSVQFSESVFNRPLNVILTRKSYTNTSEAITSVPLTSRVASRGNELVISTQEKILPLHEYSLLIMGDNEETLLSATYTSSQNIPSPVPNNNPELKEHLPYETANYRLVYVESLNIYVFNFKADAKSRTSYNEQYDAAKKAAEDFIKSKGIDINSIVIEWRHS